MANALTVAAAEPDSDSALDIDDLDLDVQGAVYELCEFAGLCGDEPEDEDFASLPKEVQLAIHTIAKWAEFDEEAAETPAQEAAEEKQEPSQALQQGQAAVAARLGAAAVQKDAGPDASDVMAPNMIGAISAPGQARNHLAALHGVPKAQLASTSGGRVLAIHEALHAKGNADHNHENPSPEPGDATGRYAGTAPKPGVPTGRADRSGARPKPSQMTKAEGEVFWVYKAQEAEQIVYSLVLHPGGADYHGDTYSAEEIEKAAHKFMQRLQRQQVAKGAHNVEHSGGDVDAEPIESYIAPQDFTITDPAGKKHLVPKGGWVLGSKIFDPTLWSSIMKGERTGVSIEGMAVRFAD